MHTGSFRQVLAALAVTALAASAPGAPIGPIRYVDDNASPGGSGLVWFSAYRFLQDALAEAADPERGIIEIRVAGGMYRPDRSNAQPLGTGDRHASFHLLNGVAVRGGYLGPAAGPGEDPDQRDFQLHPSLLSGDLHGDDTNDFNDNSYHVMRAIGVDQTAVLDGFTITSGNASAEGADEAGAGLRIEGGGPLVTSCDFFKNRAAGAGAGVYNYGGDAHFTACSFRENLADTAAGMYTADGDVQLLGCLFDNNANPAGGVLHLWKFQGNATITGCTFRNGSGPPNSMGVLLDRITATVTSCSFLGNAVEAVSCAAIDVDFLDCEFIGNSPDRAVSLAGGYSETFARFHGCRFEGNHAKHSGAAIWVGGGQSNFARLWAYNCQFVGNTVGEPGGPEALGGAIFTNEGPVYLYGCTFVRNQAYPVASDFSEGGAMCFFQGAPYRVVNCVFTGNTAKKGGAVYVLNPIKQGHPLFANCAFVNNVSTAAPGGAVHCGGDATLFNCIAWNNGGTTEGHQLYAQPPNSLTVSYSLVQGLTGALGGAGNIGLDPQFIDLDGPDRSPGTEDDDVHLAATSPGIDAGADWGLPADESDLDGDGDTSEIVPVDFEGHPRIADASALDTGCGVPAIVDMGIYELAGPAAQVTYGDIDGSGTIAVAEFLGVLGCWGPAGGACCTSDLDLDGAVGTNDLLLVLGLWSP